MYEMGDDCGGKTKTGEGGGRYDIRENDNSRRAPASSRIASSPSHTLSLNLTFGSRNISTEILTRHKASLCNPPMQIALFRTFDRWILEHLFDLLQWYISTERFLFWIETK